MGLLPITRIAEFIHFPRLLILPPPFGRASPPPQLCGPMPSSVGLRGRADVNLASNRGSCTGARRRMGHFRRDPLAEFRHLVGRLQVEPEPGAGAGIAKGARVLLRGGPLQQDPVRADEVAGVAVRVALEIILMLGLGLPERAGRRDFGRRLARPQT